MCVGESPGAPLLVGAKSCRAWQCKPMKNCTSGRRCTAPGSWQSGKTLLLPFPRSPSCELSLLATRFNPVNAKFCASLRAERENDPSRELMVLRPEIPAKVLETKENRLGQGPKITCLPSSLVSPNMPLISHAGQNQKGIYFVETLSQTSFSGVSRLPTEPRWLQEGASRNLRTTAQEVTKT